MNSLHENTLKSKTNRQDTGGESVSTIYNFASRFAASISRLGVSLG